MDVPAIVESSLDGEEVAAQVSLGGEDELYITPSRTLIYRSEGLLSDESVEEYSHEAERLVVSEGRRKARFSLDYPLEGTQEFTIPSSHTDDALHPVLAGLLNAGGVTEPGETVLHTYWFSELTLVITSERLVKHIGESVWDNEHEEFPFSDISGITFEHGEHATQLVLDCNGRKERIKIPSDQSREFEEHLKRTLYEYYDVSSMGALREKISNAEESPDDEAGTTDAANVDFGGGGIEPLDASPSSSSPAEQPSQSEAPVKDGLNVSGQETESTTGTTPETASQSTGTTAQSATPEESTGTTDASDSLADEPSGQSTAQESERESVSEQPASSTAVESELQMDGTEQDTADTEDVAVELRELREVVEKQNKLLARQQQTIEQLVEELRRGR
jgi:hypothetical protein